MGYDNLTVDARSTLQEIARMAYGSGLFEGTSGGKGRMGVLCDANGKARIIKFNTHVGERLFGDSLSENSLMLESSNRLRTMIKSIADGAGLDAAILKEIYNKLGIDKEGTVVTTDLLSRKIVAKVVNLIGGDQVWQDAWTGQDKAAYVSQEHTQMSDLVTRGISGGHKVQNGRNVKTASVVKDFSADEFYDLANGVLKNLREKGVKTYEPTYLKLRETFTLAFTKELAAQGLLKGTSREQLKACLEFCAEIAGKFGDDEIEKIRAYVRSALVDIRRQGVKTLLQYRELMAQFLDGGTRFADLISPTDWKSVGKLLGFAAKGKQTTYKAKGGRNPLNYADLLRTVLVTMIPTAAKLARQIQPEGEISLDTWWRALKLDKWPKPPAGASDEEIGNALMNALFERTVEDFRKFMSLTDEEVELYLQHDPEGDDHRNVNRHYQTFLMFDECSYRTHVNMLTSGEAGVTDPDELRNSAQSLSDISAKDTVALAQKIANDTRAMKTLYYVELPKGGREELIQVGTHDADQAVTNHRRLMEEYKFTDKQVLLLFGASNRKEQALLTMFGGAQHQYNYKVKVRAEGDPDSPDMRVTYTMPLIKEKQDGSGGFVVKTKNVVHEVVYRRDGSSEAVKLCLEQSDDPNRQEDKEIGDLTEFVNDVKQGG